MQLTGIHHLTAVLETAEMDVRQVKQTEARLGHGAAILLVGPLVDERHGVAAEIGQEYPESRRQCSFADAPQFLSAYSG